MFAVAVISNEPKTVLRYEIKQHLTAMFITWLECPIIQDIEIAFHNKQF